jgi:hypothetical protein
MLARPAPAVFARNGRENMAVAPDKAPSKRPTKTRETCILGKELRRVYVDAAGAEGEGELVIARSASERRELGG